MMIHKGGRTLSLLLPFAISCESFLPTSPLLGNSASSSRGTAIHVHRNLKTCHETSSQFQLHQNEENDELIRRDFLSSILLGAASTVTATATATATTLFTPSPSNAIDLQPLPDEPTPPITHKVKFNVRISRADGTFYTRAEPDPPTPDAQVFTGSITLGLFGTLAPNHVERFLNYVNVPYSPADDRPLPSYARSQFPSLDQSTGLLTGGFIPGLHLTTFAGSSALEYGGRILSSKLWTDDFRERRRMSHSRGGLLTHRDLEVLPSFGITTRAAPELNAGYTVFGMVLPEGDGNGNGDDSSKSFLGRCLDLPTYSLDRPAVPIGEQPKSRAAEEVASSVYSFQKDLFRSAAKTFGDTRLDNVYEGKILRRVEVTSVSFEKI